MSPRPVAFFPLPLGPGGSPTRRCESRPSACVPLVPCRPSCALGLCLPGGIHQSSAPMLPGSLAASDLHSLRRPERGVFASCGMSHVCRRSVRATHSSARSWHQPPARIGHGGHRDPILQGSRSSRSLRTFQGGSHRTFTARRLPLRRASTCSMSSFRSPYRLPPHRSGEWAPVQSTRGPLGWSTPNGASW